MPSAVPSTTPSPAVRTLGILTGAAGALTCLLALLPAAGHDQMWLLYAARLMLRGKTLYGSEIFESNPPLIVWLSAVPEWLAAILHLPDTAIGKALVLALAGAVGWASFGLLRRLRPAYGRASWLALAFAYVAIFGAMPVRDFGQRDYLLALLVLPYVLLTAVRQERLPVPTAVARAVGLAAGLGIAFKPQQIVIVLALEALLLLGGRTRGRRLPRPELLVLVAVGLAYLIAARLLTPLYFAGIVPLLRQVYWAYSDLSCPALLAQSIQLHLLAALTVAFCLACGWRKTSPPARTLLVAGLAGMVGFYLQDTGWYYQQLPALSYLALALTLLLLDLAGRRRWTMPAWAPAGAATLSLVAVALTACFAGFPFTPERSFPIEQPDESFFAGLAPGTPVMTISPSVDDVIQPLFKYKLTLAQRYPHFLLLPALLRAESSPAVASQHHLSSARLAELDRIQHLWMLEDLQRWQPKLILVERCQDPKVACQELEDRHDDLLAFFLHDPSFAKIFAQYHLWRSAGAYDAYLRN